MSRVHQIVEVDQYLELVRNFPLRRLRGQVQYAQATRVFTTLSLKNQSARESSVQDYLDVLAGLIDQYERDSQLKMGLSHRTAADAIRHLIEVNGLTVSGLATEIGVAQSNLQEMLSGRRDFSKAVIAKLCDRFGLNPKIFFK
jgi:antitoxin component HigA of HigAB toxin-antitoxin module